MEKPITQKVVKGMILQQMDALRDNMAIAIKSEMCILRKEIDNLKATMVKLDETNQVLAQEDATRKRDSFESACSHVIKWLNDNENPHCSVLINSSGAELAEGKMCYNADEFIKD